MEPPPSPNPEPPQLLSVPKQQQHHQQQNYHHQRPQSPVSKRRKVEQRVVVTVRVDESPGKHRPDGSSPPSDLWSWRKYGQKPIKGSPYPRGYYRCSTSKGCSAKKQVERCRTDASLLVITYTSTHNHEGPHLHQITSSPPPQPPPAAAPMEYKALDSMERGEEVDSPASPDPGHNCHCAAGSNTNPASCCASAAGHGVSDNCNTVVASGPNMNDEGGDGGPAVAGPELHQVSGSSVGEAEGKLLDGCNIEDESARQSPPSSSHEREGEYLRQVTCSATPAGDNILVSCNGEENVSEPSSTSVSKGYEAEAKVDSQNLNSEELPVCSKQPTPSPAACEEEEHPKTHDEEQDQPRHPSPPLEHSPEGKPTSTSDEAATHTVTNHTLQTEDVPSDDASVVGMLSSTQAGLSSEEFDFYDELDELPTIPPWTSILMGSFFDERILLPS